MLLAEVVVIAPALLVLDTGRVNVVLGIKGVSGGGSDGKEWVGPNLEKAFRVLVGPATNLDLAVFASIGLWASTMMDGFEVANTSSISSANERLRGTKTLFLSRFLS